MTRPGPQPIGDVIAELFARRGLGRQQSARLRDAAWRVAVGEPLALQTRPGSVRRGKLEVIVANSTLLQELTFQKAGILARLAQQAPELAVNDLKFRVGAIDCDIPKGK